MSDGRCLSVVGWNVPTTCRWSWRRTVYKVSLLLLSFFSMTDFISVFYVLILTSRHPPANQCVIYSVRCQSAGPICQTKDPFNFIVTTKTELNCGVIAKCEFFFSWFITSLSLIDQFYIHAISCQRGGSRDGGDAPVPCEFSAFLH